MVAPGRVLGLDGSTPPSEKLNLAGIGVAGQGNSDLNQMKSEKLPEEMTKDLETRQRKALREWQTSTLVKKGAIVPDEEKLVETVTW